MQPFTQKYGLIQLFEPMAVGTTFSSSSWPLHSTVADVFAIDWDVPTMTQQLSELLRSHPQATSSVVGDTFFGPEKEVHVSLLEKTDSLVALHNNVIALLKNGGWKPHDPQFAEAGFLPHSTMQSHAQLQLGDQVTFDALSLIDFFPGGDPYQRKLLATISISGT